MTVTAIRALSSRPPRRTAERSRRACRDDGNDEGNAGQDGRVLESVQHLRGDRAIEPVRLAKVAVHGVEDPMTVLHVERLDPARATAGLA